MEKQKCDRVVFIGKVKSRFEKNKTSNQKRCKKKNKSNQRKPKIKQKSEAASSFQKCRNPKCDLNYGFAFLRALTGEKSLMEHYLTAHLCCYF